MEPYPLFIFLDVIRKNLFSSRIKMISFLSPWRLARKVKMLQHSNVSQNSCSHSSCITLPCRRIQRLYSACLQSLEGRPRSSFPVVALITSKPWSPTVQFTLKLGAFPGWRASALLIPLNKKQTNKNKPKNDGFVSILFLFFIPILEHC